MRRCHARVHKEGDGRVDSNVTATWRKSRRSDDKGGACVELAALPEGVGVRDSTAPHGPRLLLDTNTFRALLTALKEY
ncbi:DUF397 domain-containing protein [Actinomadura sp. B10D3]|uniref:DUF397 domain-containing protein n=1 Tax=Actinomadura sp. B10D3 TaxID=3153557 RepID=UPI00325E1260